VLLNRQPPAEADFQRFFCVTPPSVHQMIMQLERLGLIRRMPRQARSIKLLVPEDQLPRLQPIKTSVAGISCGGECGGK
jgi:DNA-binding FadR family transcriptional regulator